MIRRLLVVTDHTALGDVLQDRFQELGFSVLTSPPGMALQRLGQWGQPDGLLWDLAPGEDAQAAAVLRARFDPPPALVLLAPPGARIAAPPGTHAVERPVEFEELANAVELGLASVPEPDEAKRLERSRIKPFAAEAGHRDTGRRTRLDRQGVKVLNLDLGGIGFESLTSFQEDAEVTLWLPVPGETKRLRLQAQVRWCHRRGPHALVGCRFEALGGADVQRLERILEAQRLP